MKHQQTERRHDMPRELKNYVHTAEEMQSAIAEIVQLEQQLKILCDTNAKLLMMALNSPGGNMKLEFPKRPCGKKSLRAKIVSQIENFFYHWRNGKSMTQAWHLASRTF